MDFAFDARTEELREQLTAFMDEHVYPAEPVLAQQLAESDDVWAHPPIVEELKAKARAQGLWNLFLPGDHGAGLTNLQYAPLAEIMGRSPRLAPEATNCSAPDTGNMEVLSMFGTEQQREQWLKPLLEGEIRSAFCMTEPDVASSDATNIGTRIERDGDSYVINGRKWWSSGAMSPRCKILIVMGKTDPGAERHRQQSQVLVPVDTPGVHVKRGMYVFGYSDGDHGGHAEIVFDNVRVPASNVVSGEGEGFAIAQARLGPGRIHHCMRAIGMAERALELMCRRVSDRVAFGGPIADQGVVQQWIADARIRIETTRLLVLKTAWLMDTVGNKGAHTEIQAIKVAVPEMVTWVIDRAIQAHGGGGVSQDFPLANLYAHARTLHIVDGPDEVHRRSLARRELKKYR
ncbi:acyl-CoA dehydrogenase [Saccharopolyspora erythraea NRRL 2338]|uniref:Acyl-CoA dehydrogenase n=2 Tax=Saccharopolyspora erythraea TaxID=1836 RepID=A4FKP3_SACEN|nr:acyl-CoA dehydrogenase family protein [Saccharopolyspora erythraea]EQD84508.1 acyl-CoA dehydrogenase [Saccharopolyspora erythraea D]PFG98256.1 acyl-CoA dehydrogenase [Saccharopolyspora erythraea NRRL 2338]QRK88351.1 acyl-CoA dehydrogenase family protein [Saccharopolyspora erythraea]CAM04618.1 putative acyl-CoA dehydrogenase [Saccharopolyspora erythraea NRRL 2338]